MTIAPWIPADWTAPAGVVAGCTTRQGGVSEGRYATLNIGEHVGDAAERAIPQITCVGKGEFQGGAVGEWVRGKGQEVSVCICAERQLLLVGCGFCCFQNECLEAVELVAQILAVLFDPT